MQTNLQRQLADRQLPGNGNMGVGSGRKAWMTEGHKETFGGDGYVSHPGCAGGFMSAYVCQNSSKCSKM